MSKRPPKFESIAREYATLWDSMEITRDEVVMGRTVDRIIAFRSAYEEVERLTGVPWYVVGIMDMRESGGGACRHLHNGDSLEAQTWQVPPNRPPGKGPFTFTQSAVDCLVDVKGWNKVKDWNIERIAYVFETMNGFGYRWGPVTKKGARRIKHPSMRSPYLWGWTNHQQRGKYIRDHVFDPTVEDKQHGCMPLLKLIAGKCGLELRSMYGATCDTAEPSPASNSKAVEPPPTVSTPTAVAGGAGILGGGAILADPVGLSSTLVAVKGNGAQLLSGVDLTTWAVPVLILAAAGGLILYLRRSA